MASRMYCALAILAVITTVSHAADDVTWRDVGVDGRSSKSRVLDLSVATARGAEALFIPNPMDAHDWVHTSTVRQSLSAVLSGSSSKKVKKLEEALKPVFTVVSKDANGRVNDGTARYVLHRYFTQKHGWTIKGLQPEGAAWTSSMKVDSAVRDVNKYMLPSYLQQLLTERFNAGVSGFDLHSVAILAAVIDHMIHAEMIAYVQSIFATLKLPIPGKKSQSQIEDVLDTFMMVFALGTNLDVSSLEDIQKAKAYLEQSHHGWPQLRDFAREVQRTTFGKGELDFAQILQVVQKVAEGYAQWQGHDCSRAKAELMTKPSYNEGHVRLSEVKPFHHNGRRSLFTDSFEGLQTQGTLTSSIGAKLVSKKTAKLVIPNYLNSQSMCLSTSSLFTVCCVNECDAHTSKLEREVGSPEAHPLELERWATSQQGLHLTESLLKDLYNLKAPMNSAVSLHGHEVARWMHRAFPLDCPLPLESMYPKTPAEWIGDGAHLDITSLENMMLKEAEVLSGYTTMSKIPGAKASAPKDLVTDSKNTAAPLSLQSAPARQTPVAGNSNLKARADFLPAVARVVPLISLMALAMTAFKSAQQATCMCFGSKGILKAYKYKSQDV